MDLSKLREKDLPEQRPGMSNTDWIIEWILARKGSKACDAGRHAMLTAGAPAISVLIENASHPNRRPTHRVRLLDMVIEIGGPLAINDYMALLQLVQNSSSKKVAEKAFDVLVTLCPEGPPSIVPKEILEPMVQTYRESTMRLASYLNLPAKSAF